MPWRETNAQIVYASDSLNSSIDLEDLERILNRYKIDKRVKIGSFTCASNVTGVILDTEKITSLLHKYGFLSFWDYSTAAPHVKIDMNSKDAIFFSGHKHLGGPQTPVMCIFLNKQKKIAKKLLKTI